MAGDEVERGVAVQARERDGRYAIQVDACARLKRENVRACRLVIDVGIRVLRGDDQVRPAIAVHVTERRGGDRVGERRDPGRRRLQLAEPVHEELRWLE